MTLTLTSEMVETLLNDKLGKVTRAHLPKRLLYEQLNAKEIEDSIANIKDLISDSRLPVSGPDRIDQWINGWGENLKAFSKSHNKYDLIPQYFHKYKYVRLNREWVKPANPLMELEMLRVIQTYLVEKYVVTQGYESLVEIGCGTAHNLVHINSVFPDLKLIGLDWASTSQDLILEINKHLGLSQEITGGRFDFFNPEYRLVQPWTNSTIATFAALEQTGNNFHSFIEWLLWVGPSCVIHIEPEQSFLDDKNLLDKLSLDYMNSRGYLSGLLNHLIILENSGKIEIMEKKRSYMGSYVLDGYSIIVWKPNK